jgi:TolB-like protein
VLNKPSSFKPQENGVVRIHAGRLRRALNHYYYGMGVNDPIHIHVPKGSYIPFFCDNHYINPDFIDVTETAGENLIAEKPVHIPYGVIALTPFRHFNNEPLENSFTEALGLQLCSSLMQFEKYSVIAYYTMVNVCEKVTDITEIASIVGAQYIFTGNVQILDSRVRLHIQLIHAITNQQLWSWMYEDRLTAENVFELQDEITQRIIAELRKSHKLVDEKDKSVAIVAVA